MHVKDAAQPRETKAVALEVKADSEGRIEGYASRFGEMDGGGDVVVRGAYAASLASRMPKMLWQHDPSLPIGMWEEASEDETGLYVRGRILDTIEKGREARALIEGGAIDGMSIGYRTIDADRGADGARMLKQLELWEVSLVTFPMLASARVDAIKAADEFHQGNAAMLKKLVEDSLREAGFSRTEAKAGASAAVGKLEGLREADTGLEELRAAIAARVNLN